jgi:hypothetical protein
VMVNGSVSSASAVAIPALGHLGMLVLLLSMLTTTRMITRRSGS